MILNISKTISRSTYMKAYFNIYTVLHIFKQVLYGTGNQDNHQNFDKSLLYYKCGLIIIGMKVFFFFLSNLFIK